APPPWRGDRQVSCGANLKRGATELIADGNHHFATRGGVLTLASTRNFLLLLSRGFSRRHDLRYRCGEVVGVDPVVAAAILERPDTHPDVVRRANTVAVMAPEGADDEMLLLCLQAGEPWLDREVCDRDVAHTNRAVKQRDVACDAELPPVRQL